MATMTTTPRDDLSRLVRGRRAELGRSLAQVVRAAGDPSLNESWVNRLELGQLRDVPKRERLASLARGLQLPFAELARAAAAQYLGLQETWSGDHQARAVVAHMEELTPAEREQVRAIVEAFARSRPRAE